MESWLKIAPQSRVDSCKYNIYYTFSEDGGLTFSNPVQLNGKLVEGESLVRFEGRSIPVSHLAIASSDDFVYPIWIGTPEKHTTQVYTVRISR
jgi:hypothetical protein